MTDRALSLGISKGSLEEATIALFHKIGLQFGGSSRFLWPSSSDPTIVPVMLRPRKIPVCVESGGLDAGIAGREWIVERAVQHRVTVYG